MLMLTFGRFDELSTKDIEKEKELFLENKRKLAAFSLHYYYDTSKIKELKESQIDNIIKKKFLEINNNFIVQCAFENFLFDIGICADLLDDDEKKEILNMNFTFENIGNFATNYYNKFVEKAKRECPSEIYICFEDKAFITYCQNKKSEIKNNNFLNFIKNYFILDDSRKFYGNFRNNEIFYKIRDQMIRLYPELKFKYGRKNIAFDKFMRFFEDDNDYNNEFIKEILDNYYNKNQNKYIKSKQE